MSKKNQEVKELLVSDLQERIAAEKANMVKVRLNHATSPVEDQSSIKKARRNIARMMTTLNQKQATK